MTLLEEGPRFTLTSDADLTELWGALMGEGGFGRRSLWLLFVDRERVTLPVLAPFDDLPLRPDARRVDGLFDLVETLRVDGEVDSFAALLSRPGHARKTLDDRAWAAQLTDTARRREVPMWPVHLATFERIQPMAADDLIGA